MPCYDSRDHPDYIRKEMSDKVNELTRLLCLQCKACAVYGMPLTPDVAKWYKAHKGKDDMRKQLRVERERRDKKIRRTKFMKLKKEFG